MSTSLRSAIALAASLGLAPAFAPGAHADEPRIQPIPKDMKMKPTVTIPQAPAPTTLLIEDLEIGNGKEATAGKKVTVHYVGVAWSTGKQFDASWDRGQPFSFPLGGGRVIKGWDQGVAGMKIGGRRKLTIPPDLGYGSRGAGGVIQPNETLVFVVDLLEVE